MESKILTKKRDKKLDLRLTDYEKEVIQETAKQLNMNTSQFIRFACKQIIGWRLTENGLFQSSSDIEI